MIPSNINTVKKRAFGGTYVRWPMNICSMAYEHMFVNQGSWLRKPTNICSFFRGYSTVPFLGDIARVCLEPW